MKKLLAALLTLTFVLTGCSGTGNSSSMPVSFTAQVRISVTNCFSFLSQNDTASYCDDDAKQTWIDYMSQHNNTDFTIYNDSTDDSYDLVGNGEREGLVLLNSLSEIETLAREDKILALDDYLADNESWQALPEEFRDTFKIDGKIYAIPYSEGNIAGSGSDLNMELAVNTQWLSQLGLEMPKTLEDFETVGKQFAQNDMNGDGVVGNDYLLGFFNPVYNYHIMQAYGLYFDPSTAASIGYDPTLGSMADALFKDNAESALTYLRQLFSEGLIDPDSADYYNYDSIYSNISAGKYGTILLTDAQSLLEAGLNYAAGNYERITGKTYDPTDPDVLAWAADVYEPLPPLSDEYPLTCSGSDSLYGYVLAAGTEMPEEVINRFVDLCYGLYSTTYLECNFGNAYTLQSDGSCIVAGYSALYGIGIGSAELNAYPNLGGYYKNALGEDFLVATGKSGSVDYAKILAGVKQEIAGYIDKYEAEGLLVEAPVNDSPSGKTYVQSCSVIRHSFTDLFNSLAAGDEPVSDILNVYREKMTLYGIADILQESNDSLGLPNVQTIQ